MSITRKFIPVDPKSKFNIPSETIAYGNEQVAKDLNIALRKLLTNKNRK